MTRTGLSPRHLLSFLHLLLPALLRLLSLFLSSPSTTLGMDRSPRAIDIPPHLDSVVYIVEY